MILKLDIRIEKREFYFNFTDEKLFNIEQILIYHLKKKNKLVLFKSPRIVK